MGVIIFTHDAKKYREGDFVEGNHVLADPNCADLTVIVHKKKPTAKECLDWLPYIAYRMIWVCENPPKINNDSVIMDGNFKKKDLTRSIDGTMRWKDRVRAHKECVKVPVPLMLAFLRENNNDIHLWRILAKGFTNVPESFQQALITFAHKPVRKMKYPKKKAGEEVTLPFGIRSKDKHWEKIINLDEEVANDLRRSDKASLPKGVKKRMQTTMDGWL